MNCQNTAKIDFLNCTLSTLKERNITCELRKFYHKMCASRHNFLSLLLLLFSRYYFYYSIIFIIRRLMEPKICAMILCSWDQWKM